MIHKMPKERWRWNGKIYDSPDFRSRPNYPLRSSRDELEKLNERAVRCAIIYIGRRNV
jgi:hypothetical protein